MKDVFTGVVEFLNKYWADIVKFFDYIFGLLKDDIWDSPVAAEDEA